MKPDGPVRARGRRSLMTGVTERFREVRWNREMTRGLRRRTVPPPPEVFGKFGSSYIVAPARVDAPECIFIGDDVVLHEGIWLSVVPTHDDIAPRLEIGDRTVFGRFCQISCVGHLVVEEDVLASDQVQIGDTFHEYGDPALPATRQPMARPQAVRIGRGSLLGLGAIVLPGVSIGERAYVVEGSVVTADVPAGAVVAGNPARIVERPGEG